MAHDSVEQVMCSRARHGEKFTDEKIFTARVVEEGIVLAAEERFKRTLPRQRDTGGSRTDPVDMETQHSLVMRAHKTTHPTSRQGGAP